jgi:putative transport protein
MLDVAREIIGTQPILAAFLAIGVGFLVGQINIFGFSLGVGAVLFVGLAIGAFAPKAQITGPIGLTGLVMFLYGIGILYGREFFDGMTGAEGRKYNLLALVACVAGLLVALGLGQTFGIKIGHTLGVYAGSLTSTPTLQAALDVMDNSDPSTGYSIAYPFGVIGPILCMYLMTRRIAPKFPPKAQRFHMGEIALGNDFAGRSLAELSKDFPSGVQVTMVRKRGQNIVPRGDLELTSGDASFARCRARGRDRPGGGQIGKPGYRRNRQGPFVSRLHPGLCRQGQRRRSAAGAHLLHVRRYDVDIIPTPELTLEFGDRVSVLMPPDRKEEVRRYFGDTVKSAAEFSYVSLGLGMVLGVRCATDSAWKSARCGRETATSSPRRRAASMVLVMLMT